KLFSTHKLSGRVLHEADGPLTTGHLSRGPCVDRLRERLAEKYRCHPDNIVLGASATACFHGLCLFLKDQARAGGARFVGEEPWPLLPEIETQVFGGESYRDITVVTEIGGEADLEAWKNESPILVDACHSCT